MGRLTQSQSCRKLDGYPLSLSGPVNRSLSADGNAWFGAVDLPPGEYRLAVSITSPNLTLEAPVTIAAGAVTEQEIFLPACTTEAIYIPLVLKQAGP
jgi:hypothetical protein